MLSKKQGRSYIVQDYEGDYPRKLNRKKTDKALALLEKSFRAASKAISDLYDDDTELYWFIVDNIWLPDSYYICNDKLPETMSDIYRSIKDLQDFLKEHDDKIKPPEETIRLEDLGFKDFLFNAKADDPHVFERTKYENDDSEVIEEIVFNEGKTFRRIRTTMWEKTKFGKTSTSIKYKKRPLTKELKKAAENTMQHMKEKQATEGDKV